MVPQRPKFHPAKNCKSPCGAGPGPKGHFDDRKRFANEFVSRKLIKKLVPPLQTAITFTPMPSFCSNSKPVTREILGAQGASFGPGGRFLLCVPGHLKSTSRNTGTRRCLLPRPADRIFAFSAKVKSGRRAWNLRPLQFRSSSSRR